MTEAAAQHTDFDVVTRWEMEARPEELTEIILDPELVSRWATSVFMACEVVNRGRFDGMDMEIRVHTKGFLPHSFFFGGRVTALERHRWMAFDVYGDFTGRGLMRVEPAGAGRLTASFHWQVDIAHPWVRRVVRPFHRVLLWNHRWAMRRLSRMMQAEVRRRRARRNAIVAPAPTFPHNLVPLRRWQKKRFAARGWLNSAR